MASITTRAGKGSPLTNAELDANFNNINAQLSTAVITGGTIDGATIGATTATTGKFSQLDVDNLRLDGNTISSTDTNGNVTIAPNGTGIATFSKATVVSTTDNTNAALRITQLGTGNALLVEDSTNPDSTPFVIDNSGYLVVGHTSRLTTTNTGQIESVVTSAGNAFNAIRFSSGTGGAEFNFAKSDSDTVGTNTVVASADTLGTLSWSGADGTNYIRAAQIFAAVDGTPGTNDMPGRLVFSTTADGASSPTERMRIDSAGNVGIGSTSLTGRRLVLSGTVTGSTTSYGEYAAVTFQSDVTTHGYGVRSQNSTQATAFTLTNLSHFGASQGTVGAGSTVTNQYGFNADSSLIGATNNYGFYSNIASGTGRYNFYAAGTAENFFGGNTVISVTDNTNAALRITQLGTGNALLVEDSSNPDSTPTVITGAGQVVIGNTAGVATGGFTVAPFQIQAVSSGLATSSTTAWNAGVDVGSNILLARSAGSTVGDYTTVASGNTLGNLRFYGADGTAFIEAAKITAAVDGTPGTNDMPGRLVFSTTADGASTPTERMRIDSSGNVGIGTSSPVQLLTVESTSNVRATIRNSTENTSYASSLDFATGSGSLASSNVVGRVIGVITQADPSTLQSALTFHTNGGDSVAERMRIDSSGNLLVGGTSQSGTANRAAVFSANKFGLSVIDTTAQTTGVGGALNLGGNYRSTGDAQAFCRVAAAKENSTDGNFAYAMTFATTPNGGTFTEAARIDSSGNLLVGKTATSGNTVGSEMQPNGLILATRSGGIVGYFNRQTNDGTLIEFAQANITEGTISVSGTTVSYNGGHLSRWAQTTTAKDESLVKGTVLSNLDEMNVYTDAEGNTVENEQLNKVKVSDVEGDANVAGVFVNWEHDEAHDVDEINMAMTGDMIIRIAQGVTVARGDLLMSAGDGTAKPQGDDIVRSKTVAKVTSTHVTCTYADGSYCVPCVLMAC